MLTFKPLVEPIDVDMKSRRFSFPFFHQVLVANGALLLLFAWFDASPVLILLFELLTTLLLSLLLLRGKDKGDIVGSDVLVRFLLLWLLLLRLLLIRWLVGSKALLAPSKRKVRLWPLILGLVSVAIFVCGLKQSGVSNAPDGDTLAICLL